MKLRENLLFYKEITYELTAILVRIDRRQRIVQLSDRAVSVAAGLSPEYLRSLRRQHQRGTQHGITAAVALRLARALRTTPQWLISGAGPEEPENSTGANKNAEREDGRLLQVIGSVAPGNWIEAPSDLSEYRQFKVAPDPRYDAKYQYALEVRGNAIDRVARSGDFLLVFDHPKVNSDPRSADLVIVTRRRNGLSEVTARRIKFVGPDVELSYDSTDPRYNNEEPIRLRLDQRLIGDTTIDIGGAVVAVYRSLT
jgi:SOS-response transcriptional repressor LexA